MPPSKSAPPSLSSVSRALSVALGERDLSTLGHSERVVKLSIELAIHLDFTQREVDQLTLGAEFHDIGKIGIPDHVLHKPAPFDQDEWDCMKLHPIIGERIIRAIGCEQSAEIARIVRHHHEHFDGSGYPDQLLGSEIPVFARIISLADCYDAVSEPRPYHKARQHTDIMNLLESESGTKHDPDLLHAFSAMIEKSTLRTPDTD
jgi:HD-GYP domain-containing protein (c-di-GMP phosphodiesterase class II)